MRVSVAVDDLEDAVGGGAGTGVGDGSSAAGGRGRGPGSGPSAASGGSLQLAKARTVASSLDLRGARVDEALEALDRYLDDASLAGLEQVLIIHGLGTGALRDAVRTQAGGSPLVKSLRPGERGEGGDGATIVRL
jgi:dsDNA-specific endonuclease/ATPase MutS2